MQFSYREFPILFAFTDTWVQMQDLFMQLWILFRNRYFFSPCAKHIEARASTLKACEDVIYKFTAFTKVITFCDYEPTSKDLEIVLEIVLTLLNSSCSRNLGQDN